MRIGIVCPYSFDYPGGVQAHVVELADVLIRQGHEVAVLGPGTSISNVPEFVQLGGSAVPLKYNGSVARVAFGPRAWVTVRRFIKRGRFDVLHIHEPNAPSYSLLALVLAKGPIVATYHASAASSLVLRLARPFLQPALEKIQAGISVSEMARRWQVEQLGGDPVLIPNGVDVARFRRARASAADAPGDPRVHVVFLGRLDEPRKGLDVFVRALEIMEEKPRVTVVGGGAPTGAAGIPGVDFVGRVDDGEKARILGEADIYVAPNTGGESFGIVLVEAMAAGCAVVASDIEAFAAVCDAGGDEPAGALFPVGDATALARTLDRLIRDSGARERLARAGQRRAQRYDWSVVARQVVAVYDTVTDPSGAGVTAR